MRLLKTISALLLVWAVSGWSQSAAAPETGGSPAGAPKSSLPGWADPHKPPYVLGPGDEVRVTVLESEEFDGAPIPIGTRGQIDLPLAGRVRAAGLNVRELEQELTERLSAYIRQPHVAVTITRYRSQPVSVIGAVEDPGVHQLEGPQTLVEVLSLAGGLRQDSDNMIKITRRKQMGPIPLESAEDDASGEFSVAEVNVKQIMEAQNPHENILIRPHDVISVPRAKMIYVIGAVGRSGGFVLIERESVSVLEALALAQGLTRTASAQNAKILRPTDSDSARQEIAVDVKKIMAGKSADVPLKREDILFIPGSTGKAAALRAAEVALGIGSTAAIWRVAR